MRKFIWISLVSFIMALMSCSHELGSQDFQTFKKDQFSEKFVKTFGEPASDQDWGFDNIPLFDYTQKSSTRGVNVNGNLWYKQWERPINVTDAEKAKVIEEFSVRREGATHTINLPWDNYWVQQVYQGTNYSIDGTNKKVYPKDVMNQLIAWNFNTNSYEHVNNFNNANNTTEYTDDETKEKYYGTTLMVDMGTGDVDDQFGYHNTSSSNYYYDYIILEIDGAYYVGFDIVGYHPVGQDANANMDVNRDWIFNDWIVKISPAKFNMEGAVRIIAEDLGKDDGSDFDYNDVVFDAKVANEWVPSKNNNRLVAYITLQAAGGTLELMVGGQEVHRMFGVDVTTMVNTGLVSKSPVSYKVDLGPADWSISGGQAVKSIPVIVYNNNQIITLGVETGQAPEKIAVSTSFKWCSERQPIYEKYVKFPDWVQNKSIVWY